MRTLSPEMQKSLDNYCAADRTDPFTRARAVAHMKSGIVQVDAHYHAEKDTETRSYTTGEGVAVHFNVPRYIDMKRP